MTTGYWLHNNCAAVTTMLRMAPPPPPHTRVSRPTLHELRTQLRAGMPRDEFFALLDALAKRGLRFRLPAASADVVTLPVAEGGELLCFIGDHLTYAEYDGDVMIEYAPAFLSTGT